MIVIIIIAWSFCHSLFHSLSSKCVISTGGAGADSPPSLSTMSVTPVSSSTTRLMVRQSTPWQCTLKRASWTGGQLELNCGRCMVTKETSGYDSESLSDRPTKLCEFVQRRALSFFPFTMIMILAEAACTFSQLRPPKFIVISSPFLLFCGFPFRVTTADRTDRQKRQRLRFNFLILALYKSKIYLLTYLLTYRRAAMLSAASYRWAANCFLRF